MFYYYDPTYSLVLIGIVICMLASSRVNHVFRRYASVRSMSGMTGREAAERILRANGIYDVQVCHISGHLNDHYDPRNKILRLSDATYNSPSVAAIGVAAHECGHAVANFGSTLAWPLILIGLLIRSDAAVLLINLGILLFSAAVLFQIVTLPVEFNASRRAVQALEKGGMLYGEEIDGTKAVLRAAALTYVASAASMILQLLRLIIIGGRRQDD